MNFEDLILGEYTENEDWYICSEEELQNFHAIRNKNYGQLAESFFNQRDPEWIKERKKLKNFNSIKGRRKNIFSTIGSKPSKFIEQINDGISKYDELKCKILYEWFNRSKKDVIDPFAGGCTRGIIANMCDMNYTGIDIRKEQIAANYEEYTAENCEWICGDSQYLDKILKGRKFGHCQTSPPFPFVEHYSTLDGDLSNLRPDINAFKKAYKTVFEKVYNLLEKDSICCVDIGDGRDKKGNYYLFPEWQSLMMEEIGFKCINKIASITQPYSNRSLLQMQKFMQKEKDDNKLVNTLCMVYIYKKM